ncbi:MAG: E3 ubiquitin-protein ligase Jade-2 [Marteilia pararefringens]
MASELYSSSQCSKVGIESLEKFLATNQPNKQNPARVTGNGGKFEYKIASLLYNTNSTAVSGSRPGSSNSGNLIAQRVLPLTGKFRSFWITDRSIQIPSSPRKRQFSFTYKPNNFYENKLNKRTPKSLVNCQSEISDSSYCLDKFDLDFLPSFNENYQVDFSSQDFESLINYFEDSILYYFQRAHLTNLMQSLPMPYASWYSKMICQICFGSESEHNNKIVLCEGCDLCVHQSCYGIPEIPAEDWLCKPCKLNLSKPMCYLCGNDTVGAFTSMKSKEVLWAHNLCALWIPEVIYEDVNENTKVRVTAGGSKRTQNCCCICFQSRIGLCIECNAEGCNRKFHVSCAFAASFIMLCYVDSHNNIHRECYCNDHLYAGYVAQNHKKSIITCFPPESELFSPKQSNKTYDLWCSKAIKSRQIAHRFGCDETIIGKLIEYWMLRKRNYYFYSLKPVYLTNNCKNLSRNLKKIYEAKIKLTEMRVELEKLRNMSYLIVKREKLKFSVFKLFKHKTNDEFKIPKRQTFKSDSEFNGLHFRKRGISDLNESSDSPVQKIMKKSPAPTDPIPKSISSPKHLRSSSAINLKNIPEFKNSYEFRTIRRNSQIITASTETRNLWLL